MQALLLLITLSFFFLSVHSLRLEVFLRGAKRQKEKREKEIKIVLYRIIKSLMQFRSDISKISALQVSSSHLLEIIFS